MDDKRRLEILTINTGSSSLKVALYRAEEPLSLVLAAAIEHVGSPHGRLRIKDAVRGDLLDEQTSLADHHAAIYMLLDWLRQQGYGGGLAAIGHRVVHGGPDYSEPQLVTPALIAALEPLVPIDPDHLPQALDAITAATDTFPGVSQVACFDTVFHRHMPRVAQIYGLPRNLGEEGVLRYGFHGLSYEFIMDRLRIVDSKAAAGRLVIAHLGNGSSMAAVCEGRGIDTTMGFTPTGGLVMGTRSGDLDPGVLMYLLQVRKMDPSAVNKLVNKQAGLLGVSGTTGDMRELLAAAPADARATEAIDLYCYQGVKFLGGLVVALGGIDTLVFTGGIGENAPDIRARICAPLAFLGVRLDSGRNRQSAPIISSGDSRVTVRVIRTDEDLMIARHTWRVVTEERRGRVSI